VRDRIPDSAQEERIGGAEASLQYVNDLLGWRVVGAWAAACVVLAIVIVALTFFS
jgi:hypothetical protein